MLNLSKTVTGDFVKQSPIRKIMELADRKNIIKLGVNPDDVISFAGGWVNHKAPDELRMEYLKIAKNKKLFHANGAYSSTEGDFTLRSQLVSMEKNIYGVQGLDEDNIIIGQSSTQLLFALFLTLLNPKDKILMFDPTYANYTEQIHVAQGGNNVILLKVLDEKNWTYMKDEDEILSKVNKIFAKNKPKAVLLSSPDNPTGQIMSDRFIKSLISMSSKAGVYVLIDNAYRDQYFIKERPKHFSFSPADYDNLILINSNSKWCRGLGRRLGWIKANKKVISAMKTIQQTMILCPDTMHQVAMANYLKVALKNGSLKKYLKENRLKYQKAAEFTSKCIEKYLGMRYLKPQGGLYTVVDVKVDGEKFAHDILSRTGVIFVPGGGFGKTLKNGVRISFGPLVENLQKIEEGFIRVQKILNKG